MDKESSYEGISNCSLYKHVRCLLYEWFSWLPAFAGMTNRESRNDELRDKATWF